MIGGTLTRLGVVLVVAGALLLAGPVFGFSTFAADRGVTVDTASQQADALLGVDSEENIGQLAGNDDPQTVATAINNIDDSIVIEAEIANIPDADDSILYADTNASTVDSGGAADVEVQCADDQSVGERDVEFRVDSSDSSVTVSDARFTVTIDIQCGQGGGTIGPVDSGLTAVDASDLSISEDEQSQTLSFTLDEELESDESVIIALDEMGQGNTFDYTETSIDASAEGSVSGEESGNSFEITFEPEHSLSTGTEVSISIEGITSPPNSPDEYEAEFDRSDFDATEITSFEAE